MKKILTLMLAFALCLGMTACGEKDDGGASGQDASNGNKKIEKERQCRRRRNLGLTGGEDTMYQMIGAKEGKQFNDGSVELYLFDEDSDEVQGHRRRNRSHRSRCCQRWYGYIV